MATKPFDKQDYAMMRRALSLAALGVGRVEPNPMVGCVISRGNRIIGSGYHRRYGGPHAEIEAIRDARRSGHRSIKGATVYVTLEPCCHDGKTPPCTDALVKAGVERVVVGMSDPYEEVAGNGIRVLRKKGIEVSVGCMEDEARTLNTAYLTVIRHKRPFIILKWAQSLDGRITTPKGKSDAISGEAAHRWVHRLRANMDAICVGIGTVLADDPSLTARNVTCHRIATRVVFDSQLKTPTKSQLVQSIADAPTLILTTSETIASHPDKVRRLTDRGVEVEGCRSRGGRLSISDAMTRLGKRGFTNVLIEGGGEMIHSFLKSDTVDRVHMFIAPRVIGGKSKPLDLSALNAQITHAKPSAIRPDALFTLSLDRA